MILILGATGVLGREATHRLIAAGWPVRAATRTPDAAQDLAKLGAEVVHADLIDRESLLRACEGAEAVLAAAHSLLGTGRYASAAVDGDGHRALIDAAREARVKRFVYTSARGAARDHPVDFFRTKAVVEDHLRASGLDWTVLRPSAFMEWHIHRLLGKSIVESGNTTIFGSGTVPTNFIATADLAQYAVEALLRDGMGGRTLELGGPDDVTRREIVALYERYTGRKAKVRFVPVAMMRAMSPLLRPFNPVMSRLMAFGVWGETTDQTFDARNLPQDVPVSLTSVDAFVRAHARPAVSQH